MSYLTQSGVFSYNGYSLQGPRNSVQMEVIPIYDSTNRTVSHCRVRFSVDAWITSDTSGGASGGADTDPHMNTIRDAWSHAGGVLIVTGFGFGDVIVNDRADRRDINFGPKPQHLEMKTVAARCILLNFVIETEVAMCSAGAVAGRIGRLKEFVYNVRWSIRRNGCTLRTVEGHIEIFLNTTVTRGNKIPETADNYRHLVTVESPPGFYRNLPQEYRLSEDKRRLYFRVVDEEPESDNAYPPGVAYMRLNNGISSDLFGQGANFTSQEGWFDGEIEMAKPYGISYGWERALLIMKERILHAYNAQLNPMITFVSITESIFERRIMFSVRYRLLGSSLDKIVSGSALFTRVTTTDIRRYKQSMQLPWHQRGVARLIHDPSSEHLADGCVSNPQLTIRDNQTSYFGNGAATSAFIKCPKDAYLIYDNLIGVEGKVDTIAIAEMPLTKSTSGSEPRAITRTGGEFMASTEQSTKKYQSAGDGTYKTRFVVRGRAYRVGSEPEIPSVVKILGREAKFISNEERTEITVAGTYADCEIYAATWYHAYDVEFGSKSEMEAALSSFSLSSVILKTDSGDKNKKGGM